MHVWSLSAIQRAAIKHELHVHVIEPGCETWELVEVQADGPHHALLVKDVGQETLTARVSWQLVTHACTRGRAIQVALH